MQCQQKMVEVLMTFVRNLTLTYGKQGTILNFWQYGDLRGNFKPNFELCYVNKQPF
jgi:hypothetical protein